MSCSFSHPDGSSGCSVSFRRINHRDFFSRFRGLCREYAEGFPCENLAFCVRQFEEVLENNRRTIDDGMVLDIFQVMLEEYRDACVRRIEAFGEQCPH